MQEHATALAQVLPSGIPALRPLFQRYFEDVRYPGRLDMRAVEEIWGPLIARGNGSILAEWPTAGARGIVGTTYMRDTFNGELTAMMVFLYVMPECRGQGIGRTLLDQAETDARLRGCTSIVHGHTFTINEDGGRAIFEKRGYEVIELGFRKRL